MDKTIALIIMDGVALGPDTPGNAVAKAYTPNLDYLFANHPWTKIKAHGTAVGLPADSDMGNSEVGHNALGCGQIYAQGAKLVNQSIETGQLFFSETWSALVKNAKDNAGTLHFIGLLSDGNVHSNIDHLIAMVTQAKGEGLAKVRVHTLLDGRDVPAQSALDYIDKLEAVMANLNDAAFDARIASGGGRQRITMDRYGANWPMVKAGWDTHVHGIGEQFKTATEAITVARNHAPQIIDQDLPPFVIAESGLPVGKICDGDSVVLFNFRGDRAIELSQAFDLDDFDKFDRGANPKVFYAGMLQYDGDLLLPKNFLVAPPNITNTLSEALVAGGIAQYAVSETQKYGHVTYFWNGNKSEKFSEELETWQEIPSDMVPFEQRPWMKAAEITDCVIEAIKSKKYGFIRANMPNGDMVGHTGSFQAAEISVAAVDLCIGRLIEAAKEHDVTLIVAADHGNADEMFEEVKGKISVKTAHTLNPAPFIIFDTQRKFAFKEGSFGLANVAATLTHLMGIAPNDAWEESMLEN
ncbi:MAG: 2,3-bisphosphoglycerate-independent phosphoglycerate mutase [Clostridiales bacterium]|jgi:2,3-bisphosphoglycerate-independent phosphoglycerate mutase|nr:2,3-bisphosphoglycerate-independent phosphoglycerate mutase [Clostridiales bacterium]